ncbi:MAG: hypothetical protein K2G32_08655, partial [Oscillospiraceae bacterium]|nr:hypothetical protein [Oscillospiraceae bacterium]
MNVIFSYELDNAWCIPKHSITVYDTDVDNVVCCVDREVVKDKYTISKKSIGAICEIVEKHKKILEFRDEDIGSAGILDGVLNRFVFSDGNRRNKLCVPNLWAFQN